MPGTVLDPGHTGVEKEAWSQLHGAPRVLEKLDIKQVSLERPILLEAMRSWVLRKEHLN